MIACRDPLGIRPLVMGRLGEAYIFASETVALDVVGATYLRTVEPGELIDRLRPRASNRTARSRRRGRGPASSSISISRGRTASIDGHSVYNVRKRIGAELAQREPGRGRLCRAGARFGRAGGDRLCPAERHPVRARHHPLALCRPHLHPARRPGPPSRRQAEAQCQQRADPGQAHRPGRRFDRARHDQR